MNIRSELDSCILINDNNVMTSTHLQFRAQFVLRKFRDVKYLLRDFFKCHVLISDNPSIMIKGMQKKMSGSSKLSTK